MSASTKLLLLFTAGVAFAVGWLMNTATVETEVDTAVLLHAELIESHEGETSTTRVVDKLKSLTLVNFWASWCAPCREEMPMFEAIYRERAQDGFQLVGIAIDSPEMTQPMLDSMAITYPILYAEKTGMRVMESVGNPNGLLPYSLLLDASGKLLEQKLGTVHSADIVRWLETYQ